jgi:hypothetical protein
LGDKELPLVHKYGLISALRKIVSYSLSTFGQSLWICGGRLAYANAGLTKLKS